MANYLEAKPLYHDAGLARFGRNPVRKVVFASFHSVVDPSNGASVSTLDTLRGLRLSGFDCQVFCTTKLYFEREVCFEDIINQLGEPFQIRALLAGSHRGRVLFTRRHGVPITVMRLDSTQYLPSDPEESLAVLDFFEKFLETYKPDAMLTYGSDSITRGMIALAKRRDIPVIFAVHTFGYTDINNFWNVDYCTVPSNFAHTFYWDDVGLASHALSNLVDWSRVSVNFRTPRFVTFVNPSLEKGVYAFARIADELGRRRPDIPFLVVESRGTKETHAASGLDPDAHGNIRFMSNTLDPRQFWSLTKIALMPSLWWENQPAVGYEAMINGIPVIGSDRGGIPETLGDAGFTLPLPDRLTPGSELLPTAEEVEPWVETVIRLWDDPRLYEMQSTKR